MIGCCIDRSINLEGVLQARSVAEQQGEIILTGEHDAGVVRVASKVDVSGKNSSEKGGDVAITGHNIFLDPLAKIDASEALGGGNIHIGGNYRGKGPLPNANATVMSPDAMLIADAIQNGNGGRIILWADKVTKAFGSLSARGGEQGGNGGFIETSAPNLAITGIHINTIAPRGKTGDWLIDPFNVTISAGATANESLDTSTNPRVYTPTATGANIKTTDLTTQLNAANVTVTTTDGGAEAGTITVSSPFTWASTNTLLLNADSNINLNASITIPSGATLAFNTTGVISQTAIIQGAGRILMQGSGTLNLSLANTYSGGTVATAGLVTASDASALGTGPATFTNATLNLNNTIFPVANNITLTNSTLDDDGNSTLNGALTLNGGSNTINANTGANLTLTGGINGTGNLTIQGAGTTGITTVDIGGITPITSIIAGENTVINVNVTTTGSQTYSNSFGITGSRSFISTNGGNITFNSTLLGDGSSDITIASQGTNPGTITFADIVGDVGTEVGNLTVTGKTIAINGGSVRSTGSQIYNGAVSLGKDTTLTALAPSDTSILTVSLTGGVSGNHSLDIVGGSSGTYHFLLGGDLALTGGSITGNNTGNNTFTFTPNSNQTWNITGVNSGNITGVTNLSGQLIGPLTFSGIQNIDAGTTNTTNTLNFTAVSPVRVTLSSINSGTVVNSSGVALFNSFANMNSLVSTTSAILARGSSIILPNDMNIVRVTGPAIGGVNDNVLTFNGFQLFFSTSEQNFVVFQAGSGFLGFDKQTGIASFTNGIQMFFDTHFSNSLANMVAGIIQQSVLVPLQTQVNLNITEDNISSFLAERLAEEIAEFNELTVSSC